LAKVTPGFFPVQAHHLIPKNFLPEHRVCTWLAIKYKKNKKYELRYDSSYDNDDADNGYCMPYASPLKEWKGGPAKKAAVAFAVMEKVGIQLHQGSHATVLDPQTLEDLAGKPISPDISETEPGSDSDEMEAAQIHEPGYLNAVKVLLNAVDAKALSHAEGCTICRRKKKGKKTLALPTAGAAALMHRVSAIIKVLIDANLMFVSGYGYYYAFHKKHVEIRDGALHIRASRATLRARLVK
jgi:hypothetical protein